jgi:hypothetical protein
MVRSVSHSSNLGILSRVELGHTGSAGSSLCGTRAILFLLLLFDLDVCKFLVETLRCMSEICFISFCSQLLDSLASLNMRQFGWPDDLDSCRFDKASSY